MKVSTSAEEGSLSIKRLLPAYVFGSQELIRFKNLRPVCGFWALILKSFYYRA
jgi:hypothetical protein